MTDAALPAPLVPAEVDLRERFARIRAFYRARHDEIMADGQDWPDGEAYLWEHEGRIQLTPIERMLWHDIRQEGLILWPQYPVGRYFVDFGNPVAKVAIECDGERWHRDAKRDARRQAEIEALGWTVYRITGRDCITDFTETQDDGALRVTPGAARAFIRDIAARHRQVCWKHGRHA